MTTLASIRARYRAASMSGGQDARDALEELIGALEADQTASLPIHSLPQHPEGSPTLHRFSTPEEFRTASAPYLERRERERARREANKADKAKKTRQNGEVRELRKLMRELSKRGRGT